MPPESASICAHTSAVGISACAAASPLYLIFIKSLGGLILGVAAGAVLCSVAQLVMTFYSKEKEKEMLKEAESKAL